MKKTLAEVRSELEGNTVAMLRTIVRKDSTVKGVSRMRKAELVDAAVKVVSKLNPEVVEQPVEAPASDAVTAVDGEFIHDHAHRVALVAGAETVKAMEAMLLKFNKSEMIYVLEELTNETKTAKVYTPKAELAHQIACLIEEYRVQEQFRALTLDEKYEYLTSQTDQSEVYKVMPVLTDAEFVEIARRLGIDVKDTYVVSKAMRELRRITDANRVSRDISPESDAEPAAVSEAVSEAMEVIATNADYEEKYAALLKCSDPEMFEVMKACTGGTSVFKAEYRSHEDLAGKVLNRILQTQRELRNPKQKVKSHKELTEMTLPALRKYVRTLIVNGVAYAHNFRKYTTARWSKDDIVNELDSVRIRQESSEAYYRHEDEESAYLCKYRMARVRFEEGATYESAGEKYTVVKRLSRWVKLLRAGAEKSLPLMRVDVNDGVEELELVTGVILRAGSVPEGSSIEVGSVFAVCPLAELTDARNGYVTCTVTARTATRASLEVISASGSTMYTDEVAIRKKPDGTEYIEYREFKCYGMLEWTAKDSLIAA